MLSQDFIEKNQSELARIISVCLSLFTLLIGYNIGANSSQQDVNQLKERIVELNDFIKMDEKEKQYQLLQQQQQCNQRIQELEKINQQKQQTFDAIDQSILIQKQMKCQGN